MSIFLPLALGLASVVTPTGVELERLIDNTIQLPGTTNPIGFDATAPVPCGDGVVFDALEDIVPTSSWAYFVTGLDFLRISRPEPD